MDDVSKIRDARARLRAELERVSADLFERRAQHRRASLLAEADAGVASERDQLAGEVDALEKRRTTLNAALEEAAAVEQEAAERALAARRDDDWKAVARLLVEREEAAGALDRLIREAGSVYREMERLRSEAASRASAHLPMRLASAADVGGLDYYVRWLMHESGFEFIDGAGLGIDRRNPPTLRDFAASASRRVMAHRPAPEIAHPEPTDTAA